MSKNSLKFEKFESLACLGLGVVFLLFSMGFIWIILYK